MKKTLISLLACTLLASCTHPFTPPDRLSDAYGTVAGIEASGGVTQVLFQHDPGFEYFEGTTFVLDHQVRIGGKVSDASALEVGDRIDVWTTECGESFPVQCKVEAVVVES